MIMGNRLFRKGLCLVLSATMMVSSLYVSDNAGAAKKAVLKTKKITMAKDRQRQLLSRIRIKSAVICLRVISLLLQK